MTSCDMRPLRIVRPPPGRGVRGVLAPALVALELKSNAKFRTRTIKKLKLANVMIR